MMNKQLLFLMLCVEALESNTRQLNSSHYKEGY